MWLSPFRIYNKLPIFSNNHIHYGLFINELLREGHMAQWVKCFPCKREDLSTLSQGPLTTRCCSALLWSQCSYRQMSTRDRVTSEACGPHNLVHAVEKKNRELFLTRWKITWYLSFSSDFHIAFLTLSHKYDNTHTWYAYTKNNL